MSRGVVVAVVAALLAMAGCGSDEGDGQDRALEPTAEPSVSELVYPGEQSGRCAPVDVSFLRLAEQAFAGTVAEGHDSEVVLRVDRWYTGGESDEVRLTPTPELGGRLLSVDFEPGERYLVSATGGRVSVCGYTAPYSEDLAALYEQAF